MLAELFRINPKAIAKSLILNKILNTEKVLGRWIEGIIINLLYINGQEVEEVCQFYYLGNNITGKSDRLETVSK